MRRADVNAILIAMEGLAERLRFEMGLPAKAQEKSVRRGSYQDFQEFAAAHNAGRQRTRERAERAEKAKIAAQAILAARAKRRG